jgi:lantibiotic modifying enzyme
MAGRLMGLLCLSQHSNCSGFRGFANDDHQRLRAASIKDDNGAICFEIPDGYSGLSNKRFLGLAHGSAGVGLAIARGIRWGVLEQDDTLVREIRDTLLNVQTRRPTGTLSWPVEVGQNEETGPFWCHGVGGITQFLIESDLILRDDVNLKWIERCIETLGRSGWLFGLDLCHGTAGSVETLALARDFGHLKADRAMAAYLQCCNVFLRQLNSSSDDSLEVQEQCGLMIGHPGALYALRRISDSHRISSIWNYFAGYPSQPAMEAAPLRSG